MINIVFEFFCSSGYDFSTKLDTFLYEPSTAGHPIKEVSLGNYVEEKVPSLKHFMIEGNAGNEHSIPSLAALARSLQLLQRF